MTEYILGFAGGKPASLLRGGVAKADGHIGVDEDLYPIGYHTHEGKKLFQTLLAELFQFNGNRCKSPKDLKVGDKLVLGRTTIPVFGQLRSLAFVIHGAPGFKVKLSWENGIDPGAPLFAKKRTYDAATKTCALATAAWPADIEAKADPELWIVRYDDTLPVNVAPNSGRLVAEIVALPTNLDDLFRVRLNHRADFFTLANPQNLDVCPCDCDAGECE